MPATPRTSAWPPSLPSVPTSRATRVTSSANDDSWSTIVFTVRPMRRNSPRSGRPSISSAMCWDRSPSATATITRAISVVGRPRSSISELTARAPSAQAPSRPSSSRRSVSRPSRPTTRLIRSRSRFCRSCSDDHLVERVRHLAGRAGAAGQPDLEVAAADPPQRLGQLAEERLVVGRGRIRHRLLRRGHPSSLNSEGAGPCGHTGTPYCARARRGARVRDPPGGIDRPRRPARSASSPAPARRKPRPAPATGRIRQRHPPCSLPTRCR